MKIKILFIFILGLTTELATAQTLTKAEKKALQKEIKELQKNPSKFKELKDGIQSKKEHLAKLDGQIDDMNETIASTQDKLKDKDQRIKELSDEIARLRTEKQETDNAVKNHTNMDGIVYKVQVPIEDAALYTEMSEIDGKPKPIFSGEQDEDGSKKYTLGFFKDKNEAETFRKYLQMLRIRDAIVVTYKDGKKIQ